jgi:hypothetical protein
MIDLIIKKKLDGSIYWKASFNSKAEMDAWISIDEKTRPISEQGYEYEIVDKTLDVQNQLKLIADQNKLQEESKAQIKKTLIELTKKDPLTNADIKQALLVIANLI